MVWKNYEEQLEGGSSPRECSPVSTEGETANPPHSQVALKPPPEDCGNKVGAGKVAHQSFSYDTSEEDVDDSFDRDPEVKRNVFELMDKLGAEYAQSSGSKDCWMMRDVEGNEDCGILSLEYTHLQELNARLVV